MQTNETISHPITFSEKIKAYFQILKFRLTLTVVISAGFGYLLAANGNINYTTLFSLLVGGFLMTGAANILNQVIEIDSDFLMKRTFSRPLPSNKLSINEALFYCLGLVSVGFLLLLSNANPLTAFLTLISVILYAFVYSPMKKVSAFSVLVGAFPGAMPPLIGWAAFSNSLGIEAWIIYGLQFIWQFPHFWAIAWILDSDYKKAGFKMLPAESGKSNRTAIQIIIYTVFLLPIGLLPYKIGLTGVYSAIGISILGLLFLAQAIYLYKTKTDKAAKQLMFGSILYLTLVQILLVIDRI